MRTGDTQSNERQKLIRRPPDLLITTPESLYLMLTSSARETLQGVETVIVDEIHAMATTKRGAHLALTLERLEEVTDKPPQRIGLSATQRPLEETARFLGGYSGESPRPVQIVDAGVRKALEIEVVVPVDDMSAPGDAATPLGEPGERRAAVEHLAQHLPACARAGVGAPVDDHLHQRPPLGRALGRQAQRALRGAARHARVRAGPSPPRFARPRAARDRRRSAQARRVEGDRRHLVARARHRHGRRRSGDPDRVARRGEPRPAAHRARRALRRRAEQGHDLPQAPRRPRRGGGRRRAA